MARWIPVTERLPEDNTENLICIRNGCMFVAKRYATPNGGGWDDCIAWWAIDEEDVVLAWMPLPEPYKEGESNVRIAENPAEDVW